MVIIISQYFPALTNTCLVFTCKFFFLKSGQIYVSNIYCDAFSLGFHISVTIANKMMQITFLQTSTVVDLIFKLIISFHWSLYNVLFGT